jgi:DNA helicase II / ATP-dependent DNA helicase PcrA
MVISNTNSNIKPNFSLSIYQEGILRAIDNKEEKNLICNAVAGSGKSTTLKLVARHLVDNHGILPEDVKLVVFNRHNANELKQKFGEAWDNSICTLHSLGFSLCTRYIGKIRRVDDNKYKRLGRDLGYLTKSKAVGSLIEAKAIESETQFLKLVDLARYELSDCTPEELNGIATHHNLDELIDFNVISLAINNLLNTGVEQAEKERTLDYADMIWLPTEVYRFWEKHTYKPYKYALIDECQDLNNCQIQMVLHLAERALFVGDPKQSIYGFAGAGVDSYEQIKRCSQALELPLSVCYRCPTSHIALVNKIFPEIPIRAATDKGTGMIRVLNENDAYHHHGDLILSRKTAPLVKYCLKLISEGLPATVKGRDIGRGLVKISTDVLKNSPIYDPFLLTSQDFTAAIENYRIEKSKKWHHLDNRHRLIERLDDNLEVLKIIISNSNSITNLAELEQAINKIFSDNSEIVTLSTIHRAKGLEADRVYILSPDDMPMNWRHQKEWEHEQEKNILYVALTRSQNELYLLGDASWYQGR